MTVNSMLVSQVVDYLHVMPLQFQQRVLEFAQTLARLSFQGIQGKQAENAQAIPKPPLQGVPGKNLLRFAGTIPHDDILMMQQAIQEDCERVDIDEW